MSLDIQKQLDIRPYRDNNIVSKPLVQQQTPEPPVDEEKSNAAKWMVGLTASAAIAIGGLYAAKHGHLSKTAEKWAKKIFGETAKEAKPTTAPNATTTTLQETTAPVLAATSLVFARKGISRLIKNPNKTLTEIMTEFEKAGVRLEKKGENLLEIRTGKSPNDITRLSFSPEGTLSSIQRATKKASEEIFTFENGILRGIKRSYKNAAPEITHKIEFNEAQEVSDEIFKFGENTLVPGTLKRVKGLGDSYTTGQSPMWAQVLEQNYDKLPKELKKAKIFGIPSSIANFETAPYITAKAVKYYKANLKDIPDNIPSEVFVRTMYAKTANFFDNMVQDLDIARRISQRTRGISGSSILETTPRKIVERFGENRIARENITQEIRELMPDKYSDATVNAVVKLLQNDMGNAKDIDPDIIVHAVRNYTSILNTYKINKPEHLSIVSKKLSECKYDEFETILKELAPEKLRKLGVVADPFRSRDEEQRCLLHSIERVTGRSSFDKNTTILDILDDLAK